MIAVKIKSANSGDFDRCFIFDENGDMIEGYYIVGFCSIFSKSGAKSSMTLAGTDELVEEAGGVPVMCKSGHTY